jgi:Repeat of unknown function (DUF5648)
MLLACFRLALLLSAIVVSVHVAAAPRFWTLTGVRFNDGTFATGYFGYDDATQTISNWNVRVSSPLRVPFPAFTYVQGNSGAHVSGASQVTWSLNFTNFLSVFTPAFGWRFLRITPLTELDGSNATVSIDTQTFDSAIAFASGETFDQSAPFRWITAGSLVLMPVPPSVAIVQVDEFYNPTLGHYFITASATEKNDLDTGVHAGWERTGESFWAHATGSSAQAFVTPVCRFYSDPHNQEWGGVDSHFLSADVDECLIVFRRYASGFWMFEGDNVFQITLPERYTGSCDDGTIPVYRLWNQRADSNHRYTTSAAIKAEMLAAGYAAEGYGETGVAMCAVQ